MHNLFNPITRLPPRRRPLRDLEIINHAQTLALAAHHGQTRKDGKTPQILHPMSVQRLLAASGVSDPSVHAAALLHDALEDNPGPTGEAILADMKRSLPPGVVDTVIALTDPPGMTTKARKALQVQRLFEASWETRVIKLADVIASLQEGTAPAWSNTKKNIYLQQRRLLVQNTLGKPCGRLMVMSERALRLPVWQGLD